MADKPIKEMTNRELQAEWNRQCRIHDNGVDNLPMGHPTIENAQRRLDIAAAEIKARSLRIQLECSTCRAINTSEGEKICQSPKDGLCGYVEGLWA